MKLEVKVTIPDWVKRPKDVRVAKKYYRLIKVFVNLIHYNIWESENQEICVVEITETKDKQ